jgi:replicative DNA helicase
LRLANLTENQLTTVSNTIKEIKDYPIYIDTNFTSTPEYIVSTIRKYHKLYGIKVVHIDYLQLLVERDENSTNELGRLSRQIKLLSNSLGIATVSYSQLNRLVETRVDKRPILSDLRQSGNIEEDADVVIALYRDEVYNPETKYKGVIEFLIRKQRNGPTGVVTGLFDDVTNRIKDKE